MTELISIVMPIFNGEAHIKESMDSLINQTYKEIEILCFDDGSYDNTLNILKEYRKRDKRINIFHRENNLKKGFNKGISETLNELIKKSKGTYIARMDADDISDLRRIELQYNQMKKTKSDVCGSNIELIDKDSVSLSKVIKFPIKHEEIREGLAFYCCLAHPSVLLKKESINHEIKNLYKNLQCEDYDLWTRLIIKGLIFENIDLELIKYRIHDNQRTIKYRSPINSEFISIQREYLYQEFKISKLINSKSYIKELIKKTYSKNCLLYLKKYLALHTMQNSEIFLQDTLKYISIIKFRKKWAINLFFIWMKNTLKLLIKSILYFF